MKGGQHDQKPGVAQEFGGTFAGGKMGGAGFGVKHGAATVQGVTEAFLSGAKLSRQLRLKLGDLRPQRVQFRCHGRPFRSGHRKGNTCGRQGQAKAAQVSREP